MAVWIMRRLFFSLVCLLIASVAWALVTKPWQPAKLWGVYQINWGPERFETGLKAQIAQLDAVPDYVLFFRDLHPQRGFPTATAAICKQVGATPVISQEIWEWNQRESGDRSWLTRINAGAYDAYWKRWGEAAKAFDAEVVLRFGFEMNGDWFAWGQQPEAFIAAWRRVHRIVREEVGAMNVQFMFSPNVEWETEDTQIAIELYYPGDDVVDLLGLDGYNFGDHHTQWHRWQTYETVYEKSIEKMSQWDKPLILAEIGCADGPLKADWMRNFLNEVEADSRVSGFIYYNHFDPHKSEPNWLLDSDPETLKVFQKYVSSN
ncbi:MAG: glycosyl hydrolase [Verrucomicrobiota bacterium]